MIEIEVGQDLLRLQPVIRKYAIDRLGQNRADAIDRESGFCSPLAPHNIGWTRAFGTYRVEVRPVLTMSCQIYFDLIN